MRLFRGRRGFTLIELMIVVAVIGTLAAVAIPKFSNLLRKSKEGATKGNLGRIRSALNIYASDHEGLYPTCVWGPNSSVLSSTLVPRYIDKIPKFDPGRYHLATAQVLCHQDNDSAHDGNGWIYDGEYQSWFCGWGLCKNRGSVWVTCTHTDTKVTRWESY